MGEFGLSILVVTVENLVAGVVLRAMVRRGLTAVEAVKLDQTREEEQRDRQQEGDRGETHRFNQPPKELRQQHENEDGEERVDDQSLIVARVEVAEPRRRNRRGHEFGVGKIQPRSSVQGATGSRRSSLD